jgi:Tol biopolymer transport system component
VAHRRLIGAVIGLAFMCGSIGCAGSDGSTGAERAAPAPREREQDGMRPVVRGEPIDVAGLEGRIVFDDFEDVYVMEADGSNVRPVAGRPGPEFDAAWAPDGRSVVYRDSRRGINENDEVYVVRADGSTVRNLSRDPANDWGPDWSPDGTTIAFNSDRDGGFMSGYLVSPDGSGLRRIEADVWIEYPSFSPDGARIAFMGHDGGDYDIYVADLATGAARRLTEAPGSDGWPAWSPDGSTIAFASERDDCLYAAEAAPCWTDPGGEAGEHNDVWLMDADGSNQRRATPEFGQFVTWSPDGEHLLVSGRSLYVIRPDGTGRRDVLPASGGIPDWVAATKPTP